MSFERHSAFFKHLLDGCSNAVAANSPRRGKAERGAATRDGSGAGVWHRDSKTLSCARSRLLAARFCNGCLVFTGILLVKLRLPSAESHAFFFLIGLSEYFSHPWREMAQSTLTLSCTWQILALLFPSPAMTSSVYARAKSCSRPPCCGVL